MRTLTRFIAVTQLALIFPAALFLTSVLVAAGDRPHYGLAFAAHRIVMWYAARMWTLWSLLLALPGAVLVAGCATLASGWNRDVELPRSIATLSVAGTTMISAGILAVVALHMLAN